MGGAVVSSIAAILLAMALAQSPTSSQTASSAAKASLGPFGGGGVVGELVKSLDAKKAKAADQIEARVTMDVLSHGVIVIPRGTKIIGHVADARARTKEVPESMVEIVFDRIVLKNGLEVPVKATVQAVGAPMQTLVPGKDAADDVNLPQPSESLPAPGPNEMRKTLTTTYPGSRRPANAGGSEAQTDSGGPDSTLASLGPTSQGVVGMKGVALSNTAHGSTISSTSGNLHLSSGTQLVLRIFEAQDLFDSLRKPRK